MTSNSKDSLTYGSYLQLDKLLSCQNRLSEATGKESSHHELLFIIVHQVYELWFKEILHELDSVMDIFSQPHINESKMGTAILRFQRIIEIQKLLIQQLQVIETITPLDYLDFRGSLGYSSGFQSFQFRKVEVILGLRREDRLLYSNKPYDHELSKEEQEELKKLEGSPNLFTLIENWLARAPFIDSSQDNYNFEKEFNKAINQYLPELEASRPHATKFQRELFNTIFNPSEHEKLVLEGKRRLSHKALLAALFIVLYRDEPLVHLPFQLLTSIIEMDENLGIWRYKHTMMVLRIIGTQIGTGGSTGYGYLLSTVDKHRIYNDLFNLSSFLIPRSKLPALPDTLKKRLGFVIESD